MASRIINVQDMHHAFATLCVFAEGDTSREGLQETPRRAAEAWHELTEGYGPEPHLKTFAADGFDQVVVMRDLPFHSTCEHHLLSFHGTADFAYLPGDLLLGFSKFARLLKHYSRRLQVQERLTIQLADHLEDVLKPRGLMVVLRASHTCMEMRGVQAMGQTAITSAVRGAFKENPESRAEAMELLR